MNPLFSAISCPLHIIFRVSGVETTTLFHFITSNDGAVKKDTWPSEKKKMFLGMLDSMRKKQGHAQTNAHVVESPERQSSTLEHQHGCILHVADQQFSHDNWLLNLKQKTHHHNSLDNKKPAGIQLALQFFIDMSMLTSQCVLLQQPFCCAFVFWNVST